MKRYKLLLIILLIVGCDNSTEPGIEMKEVAYIIIQQESWDIFNTTPNNYSGFIIVNNSPQIMSIADSLELYNYWTDLSYTNLDSLLLDYQEQLSSLSNFQQHLYYTDGYEDIDSIQYWCLRFHSYGLWEGDYVSQDTLTGYYNITGLDTTYFFNVDSLRNIIHLVEPNIFLIYPNEASLFPISPIRPYYGSDHALFPEDFEVFQYEYK